MDLPPAPSSASPPARQVGPAALIAIGLVLVAWNLRTIVTSLGALLPEVSAGVGLSPFTAGVVTMLPTLGFAVLGPSAPWLARRFAPARILVVTMVILATGQLVRASTDSALVFLACTALAISGVAVANVLMPALVKQYFPDRVGLLTGVYTMCLIGGASAAAAASVPVAQLAGSWRVGLGAWAVLAALAALPWLPAALRESSASWRSATAEAGPRARIRPGRSRLGWAMGLYFGCQSLNGYALMGWLAQLFRDAGFSAATAGVLLASVTAIGIPIALFAGGLATRLPDLRVAVVGLSGVTVVAYVGLAIAPTGLAVLWVVLLAIGQGVFPLALAMIGLRARTPAGTVALSAFTQSTGYLLAGLGPLLMGVLYGVTGGWYAPLAFLVAVTVVQAAAGAAVARPRYIEDE